MTDSPGLTAAKRLLDLARTQGFSFERIAPGEDGPLVGRRDSADYKDEIYIGGFSDSCHGTRARKYGLIVGQLLISGPAAGRAAPFRSPGGRAGSTFHPSPAPPDQLPPSYYRQYP